MTPPNAFNLLMVEDEPNVGTTLYDRLKHEGYAVVWAKSAAEALRCLGQAQGVHLALLDVGLPDQSGFDVAAEIRRRSPQTAIIFLTAFGSAEDRIRGLELGAEDYVVKPFHFKELLLRVQNGLRRAEQLSKASGGPIQVGKAAVDFEKFEARVGENAVRLTHKECLVLRLLCEKQGEVVSRDEILNQAWSEDEFPTTRTVDNFIVRLRKLVETDPEDPHTIQSVRGVGYRLVIKAKGKDPK